MKTATLPAAAFVLGVGLGLPLAAQTAPELSYGIAITSNYIYKGFTQSNDNPAVQGYVEASYGMFYGGVWSSTVDFGDEEFDDQVEVDLYAGVRPTFGDLSVDFSYYRYYYNDSGDCCGAFILALGYPMADLGALGAELDYDPEFDTTWAVASASLNFLTDFTVGGSVGSDFGSFDLGDDNVAWDVGVSRGLGDFATVDLRLYDSTYESTRGVLTISLDF